MIIDKEQLKQKLISLQNALITSIEDKISTTQSMVDVDESDTIDTEDLSHQAESAETKHLFVRQLLKAEEDLRTLKKIDFSDKQKAMPGALVQTDKFNFIVASATTPFDYNGMHITGISIESPIYKQMKDLASGERFTLSGHEYRIKAIF